MTACAAELEAAPVRHVAETGSTNEDALALGRGGGEGLFWVRADRQSSGRGRRGRSWISPSGNLYCSVLLRPEAEPGALPQLSHVAAVALVDAIRHGIGNVAGLKIKWPNDVLIGDAKLAGILVESVRTPVGERICVVGWGVNCASHPTDLAYTATNLERETGRAVDVRSLFVALQSHMARTMVLWNNGKGYLEIRRRWLEAGLPSDTLMTVRGPGQPVTGRYRGIDDEGRLLVMGPQGLVTVEAGDVSLN